MVHSTVHTLNTATTSKITTVYIVRTLHVAQFLRLDTVIEICL